MPDSYDGIDPFDICMSALAQGLVTDISDEDFWVACNIAQSAVEFDVAVSASCDLKELVQLHYNKGNK